MYHSAARVPKVSLLLWRTCKRLTGTQTDTDGGMYGKKAPRTSSVRRKLCAPDFSAAWPRFDAGQIDRAVLKGLQHVMEGADTVCHA